MDRSLGAPTDPVVRTLDHEFDLVRGAIAMVASGGAPSVVLASLRFGEELLEAARRLGRASGVRIVPLWSGDDAGASLSIERAAETDV